MTPRAENTRVYRFDGFEADPLDRSLKRHGSTISVTPKVFDLLLALLERPGEVLEKEALMSELWPDSFVEESNLAQNMAVLRKALGDSSKDPKYIVTLPGRGYRLIARVEMADRAFERNGTPRERSELPKPREVRSIMIPGVIGAILLASAFAYWYFSPTADTTPLTVARTSQLTAWSGLDFYPVLSPDASMIAFCSDRTGSLEIFTRQLLQGAKETQITSDGKQNCQPSFSPDGTQIAFSSNLTPGISIVPSGGGTPRKLTTIGSRPAWSPNGSQIAFQTDPLTDVGANVRNAMPPSTIWAVNIGGGEPEALTQPGQPPGGHGAPSWSPDGRMIVFDVNDWASSSLWTLNVATKVATPVGAATRSESDPIFSRDGRSIYYVSETGAAIQNVAVTPDGKAAGEPRKILDASGTRVRQISLDRSGNRLVYATLSTSSNLWMTPVGKGGGPAEPLQLTKSSHTRTVLPAFSPDGSKIVYQSFKTGSLAHLWMMNSDGSDQRQLSSRPAFNAAWSADGSTVWYVSPEEQLTGYWSIDPLTGMEKRLFDFDELESYGARAAPDGSMVAFNSKRGGALNVWMIPITGGEPKQITNDLGLAAFPAWSPDSKLLAVQVKRGDDTHVAIMPAGGGEIVQLTNEPGQSWVNGWAGDNDRIIFAGERSGIWNVYSVSRSTREVRKITNFNKRNTYVRYPAISLAGDKVAYEYAETTGNIWMIDLK